MGMTMTQKILAAHAGLDHVEAGQLIEAELDLVLGNAAKYARKLCEDKVFTYMGCAGILMPENYLAMFRVPSEEEAKNIIADAEQKIRQVEEQILAGDPLTEEPVSMLGAQDFSARPLFLTL